MCLEECLTGFFFLFVLRKGKVTRRCTLEMSVHSILDLELLMKSLLCLVEDVPVHFSFKRIEVQSSQGYLPYHIRREVRNTKEWDCNSEWECSIIHKVFCFCRESYYEMTFRSYYSFCYCCAVQLFHIKGLLLHLLCRTILFQHFFFVFLGCGKARKLVLSWIFWLF